MAGVPEHTPMLRILILLLALAAPAFAQPALPPLKENPKVAFFGIVLLDTSHEAEFFGSEAEVARTGMITDYIRDTVEAEGFRLLDLAPVQDQIDRVASMADCYGCELRAAADLGADYSMVGEIQKVSTLIQSMNIVLRDVETGQMVRGLAVEIRNNSDEAWLRGARYILKNNFFRE